MLVDDRCSIYEDRPQTCRKFDCRVLAAAGLEPDGPGQDALAERVRRWRFDVDDEHDRAVRDAVRAAVAFLEAHPECFEPGRNPVNAVQRSVTALAVYELFLDTDGRVVEPDVDTVRAALARLPPMTRVVVLFGSAGGREVDVGAELGQLGFRWREWELERSSSGGVQPGWLRREQGGRAPPVARRHSGLDRSAGTDCGHREHRPLRCRFLDTLVHEGGCFVVRFDVSDVEAARRLTARELGRHLTDDLADNDRVRREFDVAVRRRSARRPRD